METADMTTMTRYQFYSLARAAAQGGTFKIEFKDRSMAIGFLNDVAGQPVIDGNLNDRWDLGDGYIYKYCIFEHKLTRSEKNGTAAVS